MCVGEGGTDIRTERTNERGESVREGVISLDETSFRWGHGGVQPLHHTQRLEKGKGESKRNNDKMR